MKSLTPKLAKRLSLAIALAVVFMALGGCTCCQSSRVSGDPMPERDIKTVMENHVDELMALPNVVGVAIGELDNGTPCIQVLVVEETEETTHRIPKTLEGHPVQIIESGELRPMEGQ